MWVSSGCGRDIAQRRPDAQRWLLLLITHSLLVAHPADGGTLGGQERSSPESPATEAAGYDRPPRQANDLEAKSSGSALSESAAAPSHLATDDDRGGPRALPAPLAEEAVAAALASGFDSARQTLVAAATRGVTEKLAPMQRQDGRGGDDDNEVAPSGDGEFEASPPRTAEAESLANGLQSGNAGESAGQTAPTSASAALAPEVGDAPIGVASYGQAGPAIEAAATTSPSPDLAAVELPPAADAHRQWPVWPVLGSARLPGADGVLDAGQQLMSADEVPTTGGDEMLPDSQVRVAKESTADAESTDPSHEPSEDCITGRCSSTPSQRSTHEREPVADGLWPNDPRDDPVEPAETPRSAPADLDQQLLVSTAGTASDAFAASATAAAAHSAAAEPSTATSKPQAAGADPRQLHEAAAGNGSFVQAAAGAGDGRNDTDRKQEGDDAGSAADRISGQVERSRATGQPPESSSSSAQAGDDSVASANTTFVAAAAAFTSGTLASSPTAMPSMSDVGIKSRPSDAHGTVAMQYQTRLTDVHSKMYTLQRWQQQNWNYTQPITASMVAAAAESSHAAATTTKAWRSVPVGVGATMQEPPLARSEAESVPGSATVSSGYGSSNASSLASPDGARLSAQLFAVIVPQSALSTVKSGGGNSSNSTTLRWSDDLHEVSHRGGVTASPPGRAASLETAAAEAAAAPSAAPQAADGDALGGARPSASLAALLSPTSAAAARWAQVSTATTAAPQPGTSVPAAATASTALRLTAPQAPNSAGEGSEAAAAPPEPGSHHRQGAEIMTAVSASAAEHPADTTKRSGSSSTPQLASEGTWATAGVVAGIAVGSLAACALLVGLATWLGRRLRRLQPPQQQGQSLQRRRQQREARYEQHRSEHSYLEELVMLELAKARSRGYVCDSDKVNYDEVFNLNTAISNQMITEL